MAANRSVKARRLLALLGALVLLGTFGGAIRVLQLRHQFESPVLSDVRTGSPEWDSRLKEWALDPRFSSYVLTPTSTVNAAEILWPLGLMQPALRCPTFTGLAPSHADWLDQRGAWVEAANCEHLNRFVAASEAATFDILAVAGNVESSQLLFGLLSHQNIHSGIWALIARARLDLEEGKPREAEFHLRAAMSLAAMLVQKDANLAGMDAGHRALEGALEHFEALQVSTGDHAKAVEVRAVRAGLPSFESSAGVLIRGFHLSAAVPATRRFVEDAALDSTHPLAIRVFAAYAIAHSWTGNPWHLLRGPDPLRETALQKLSNSPGLEPWVSIITSMPDPPLTARIAALREMVVAGLPRV
jgi:hypothetical protein